MDFRKKANGILPLTINRLCVERISDYCLLEVIIREDLAKQTDDVVRKT